VAGSPVTVEEREGIAYVCLNTPPRNTLNRACFEALHDAWLGRIPRIHAEAIVVHGSGRHFSAGADIGELAGLVRGADEHHPAFLERNIDTFLAIERCPIPVVAAIGGCCLGAGLELSLACHYRVAASHAVLGVPESTFGLVPGCGGTIRLPGIVGRAIAVRMILDGQSVLADEAGRCGLVDLVVDRKDLLESAARVARAAARNCA